MNAESKATEAKEPEPRAGAQGIIFAVVGAASGVFMATKLTSVLPTWAAVLLTFVLWLFLVVCMAAACGSDLIDVLMGSVTIIVVMAIVVPAFVRKWRRDHQGKPPAAHSYIEPAGVIRPTITPHSTPGAAFCYLSGVMGPPRVSAGRCAIPYDYEKEV